MNEQEQETHDRDVKIAKNEAKREFFSDVRVSTWATSIAVVLALAALTIYLMQK